MPTTSSLPRLFHALILSPLLGLLPAGLVAVSAADLDSYRPPAFVDAGRAERVRQLGPEIDAIYRAYGEREHIPGMAYGVVVDGELVLAGGIGFADVEHRVSATPRSVFRVASMTKSFTAMAVLRLRDAGRLDLDRPLSRRLPELRRLRLLTADSPALTARHLLSHSGGFPEDNPWGDRQLSDTDGDLVALVKGPAWFSNAPGVDYEYSNLGFALLGRVVARVSGRSCQRYVRDFILQPLGMNETYWEPAQVPEDRRARGYRWEEGAWREEESLPDGSFGPMGGLLSTVEDFARYVALHLSAWPPRDDVETGPIRRASLREMQQPWRFVGLDAVAKGADGGPCPKASAYAFGLGWTRDCAGVVTVGHSGGLPGFGSDWRILPAHGVGVVAFGNRTYSGMSRPTREVLALLLAKAALPPRVLPPSSILQQRARALAELLPSWEGAEASGLFAENFFPDIPLALRQRETEALFQRIGPVESVGEVAPLNQLRGTFRLRGRDASVSVFFTLTPENPPRIQAVEIREASGTEPR